MKITMNEEKAKDIYYLTEFNINVSSAENLLNANYICGDDKLFEVELLIKKAKEYFHPFDELVVGDRIQHNHLGNIETFTVSHKTAKRMTVRRDSVDTDGNIQTNQNGYEIPLSKRKNNEWCVTGYHDHQGSWTVYKG
ncbi:hypothetical protein PBI_SCTP2_63 [Salicola phage SCTP-2]|nr:hypothetical protein PBI_SCTP2_63 [Salicola phage SCTP-2]